MSIIFRIPSEGSCAFRSCSTPGDTKFQTFDDDHEELHACSPHGHMLARASEEAGDLVLSLNPELTLA